MRILSKSLIPLLLLLLPTLFMTAGGCSNSGKSTSAVSAADSRKIFSPDYASGFSISSIPGSPNTIIEVSNPWQGAKGVTRSLYIDRTGEGAPANFHGEVLEGEAQRVVCMSSSHVAMLNRLGAIDKVVGVSGIDFIANPAINSRRDHIGDVGFEGNINYELLLSLRPDLVLLYGINGASAMEGKLKELGIPYLYVGDYLEESPLGKAEWMIAVGECIGARHRAEGEFSPIAAEYISLRDSIKGLKLPRPSVMLNSPYSGSWFLPPAGSYMARLIEDAGGEYVFSEAKGNASVAIDEERALQLLGRADCWINIGPEYTSLEDVKRGMPKFADSKAVAAKQLFNNTRRSNAAGGNDFFESGVLEPQVVLRDLAAIFHPSAFPNTPISYYVRLK